MENNSNNTVILVDGSSFLYRAYYGLKPMHTSKGAPVQAVFGFCRMIKKVINGFKPQAMALVWDSQGSTIRHQLYADYKNTRNAAPSDIFDQKQLIKRFAEVIQLKQVEQSGVEADDLLYSLALDLKKEGCHVIVITSDKDMRQMVDEHIIIFDPFTETFLTREKLEVKYGFPLGKLPFYFALLGDSSDNIPGVKGIGAKGATDLVKQFASLIDLYNDIEKITKPRTRELLLQSKDDAFLSEQLFILRYYRQNLSKKDLLFDGAYWVNARPLFEELEFKSLLKDLPISGEGQMQEETPKLPFAYELYHFITVTTREQLQEIEALFKQHKACAIDTETNSFRPLQAQLIGFSLCFTPGTAYYIPCTHNEAQVVTQEEILTVVKPYLKNPSIKKYFHNAKYDLEVFLNAGITVGGEVFDTLIAADLIVPNWQSIGLKKLSEHYLNERMLLYEEVVQTQGYRSFAQVPLKRATEYAAADAHQTLKLVPVMQEALTTNNQELIFNEIELPLVEVLVAMEKEGIILDTTVLQQMNEEVTQQLHILRERIIELVGEQWRGINLNSSKQLEELLFVFLNLEPVKKTTQKTGYSTDQEVLLHLAKSHPVPGLIAHYRELAKLKSTYIDALPDYIDERTGRIHTNFRQTGIATGRLASLDPNLQNIPLKSPTTLQVRSAFKAPDGCVFMSADYSQIELRVLAFFSQDQTLMRAFQHNEDIHTLTAAVLFDVKPEEVIPAQRQIGKRINFSILYGSTAYGVAKDLDIPVSVAKKYIEKYMAQFPDITRWMEEVITETKEKGYVTTLWGRRRYVPGIYEKNKTLYEAARRVAINTKAQGTAAEIMKKGMIELHQKLEEKGLKSKLVLQIHDEILLAVPKVEIEEVQKLVAHILENVVRWNVPLQVTTRLGKDWNEVTK